MLSQQDIINHLQNLIYKIQDGSISLAEFQTIGLILMTSNHPATQNISEHTIARYLSTGWLIDILNNRSETSLPSDTELD
jgi:hypothetical protein